MKDVHVAEREAAFTPGQFYLGTDSFIWQLNWKIWSAGPKTLGNLVRRTKFPSGPKIPVTVLMDMNLSGCVRADADAYTYII